MFKDIAKDILKNYGRKLLMVLVGIVVLMILINAVVNTISGKRKIQEQLDNQTKITEIIQDLHEENIEKARLDRLAKEEAEARADAHAKAQDSISKEFDNIGLDLQAELDRIAKEAQENAPVVSATTATPKAFEPVKVEPVKTEPTVKSVQQTKPARVAQKPVSSENIPAAEVQRQQKVVMTVQAAIAQAHKRASS